MANSLEFAKKFVPVLDDIYKNLSITQGMDTGKKVDFTGTNEVNVLKTSTTGLGDYSRTNQKVFICICQQIDKDIKDISLNNPLLS